jgi:tetratricopeptide (TPR) repeat protein
VLRPYDGNGHRSSCLGWALMMSGRHADAEAEFQKYLGHLWLNHGCKSDCAARMLIGTAHNRLMQGRYREAQAVLDNVPPALGDLTSAPAQASRPQLAVLAARARLALEQGQDARVIELLEGVPDGPYLMNNAGALRGEALCRAGRVSEALPALRRAVADLEGSTASNPWLADARARLGLCELRAGHRAAAVLQARLAREGLQTQPGVSPAYRRALAALDRQLAQPLARLSALPGAARP